MNKTEAQSAIRGLWGEAFNLTPSALIQLFEIDLGQIGFNRGVISQSEIDSGLGTIFRFHNNIKLTNSSIYWNKKVLFLSFTSLFWD